MQEITQFFDFAREREKIRMLRAEGEDRPWTEDPILQNAFFCNVFREDDRTTRWFRGKIRSKIEGDAVVMATIIFRWFNYIPSGKLIMSILLDKVGKMTDFSDMSEVCAELEAALRPGKDKNKQVFTGAYIIRSQAGMDKLTSVLESIGEAGPIVQEILVDLEDDFLDRNLRSIHERLMDIPLMGPFMAYEVVTDLYNTPWLSMAKDIHRWASAGPGAARGLGWVTEGADSAAPGYQTRAGQTTMNKMMRKLLEESQKEEHWPAEWGRPWDMRTVEHTLCEYDKYRRGQGGQALKRKYRGGE